MALMEVGTLVDTKVSHNIDCGTPSQIGRKGHSHKLRCDKNGLRRCMHKGEGNGSMQWGWRLWMQRGQFGEK